MNTYLLAFFFMIAACVGDAGAQISSIHPLAPPDRSSPRATLNTFLDSMNRAKAAFEQGNKEKAREDGQPAVQCLNLQNEPPALKQPIAMESAIYLKEVLDRIQLPPESEIPDEKIVGQQKIEKWTIPFTEITLEKEPSSGLFLFSENTIKNVEVYYEKVKSLPYVSDRSQGALYEELNRTGGLLFHHRIADEIPQWAKQVILDQALWKWIGLLLYFVFGIALLFFLQKSFRYFMLRIDKKLGWNLEYYLGGLILPIGTIFFAKHGLKFIVNDLHIINSNAYLPLAYSFMALSYLGSIWLVSAFISRIANFIISLGKIAQSDMDVQLVRLGFDIITIVFVISASIHLGARLGLPTYSLVTGLGIGGVAVAFAGREALSNLIGTIVIIFDRPFKIGDFIILSEGERGVVTELGFRSTRIRTRDDILISIPNSILANSKLINESAPASLSRIRIKIGIGYDSDLDKVKRVLLQVAAQNAHVVSHPAPKVRFRSFGDSALNFELLCWLDPPELKGRITHELNWNIYKEFQKHHIEIPFPQREVHINKRNNEPDSSLT